MDKVIYYIYKITNNINGMLYIGQHCFSSKKDYYFAHGISHTGKIYGGHNTYFCRAVIKYGFKNFSKEIIEYCNKDNINDREIFYIQKYNSNNQDVGYNLTIGGDGLSGYKMTDEHKAKIGLANSMCSEETREKLRVANLGKRHTQETIEKIRLLKTGVICSEETRKKVSESNKGRIVSPETRRKIGDANKIALTGKKLSDETKFKIGLASTGRLKSNETRLKLSIANTGKTASDDAKFKMSIAKLGKKQSEETKLKRSIALRESWAKRKYNTLQSQVQINKRSE